MLILHKFRNFAEDWESGAQVARRGRDGSNNVEHRCGSMAKNGEVNIWQHFKFESPRLFKIQDNNKKVQRG